MTLGQLKRGQKAWIAKPPEAQGVGNRLIEFGFVPGSQLEIIAEAPFGGDPILVRIHGTRIAVRRIDAEAIDVSLDKPQNPS